MTMSQSFMPCRFLCMMLVPENILAFEGVYSLPPAHVPVEILDAGTLTARPSCRSSDLHKPDNWIGVGSGIRTNSIGEIQQTRYKMPSIQDFRPMATPES